MTYDSDLGKIMKITGARILVQIMESRVINKVSVNGFLSNYVSIGSLVGTKLVDGRIMVMTVEEIYESDDSIFMTVSISGIYDEVLMEFSFGTNSYPLVGETVFKIGTEILRHIFSNNVSDNSTTIGQYVYNSNVSVSYNPNILFGKHLGVFGNTGSGKTCTVVSIVQNYIRKNSDKNIKFIILDVNGEYTDAFDKSESDCVNFAELRFHHSLLNKTEYGRLFRAAEGVQYPAMKDCIDELVMNNSRWDLNDFPHQIAKWIEKHSSDNFSKNQLNGYLRTMNLRVDGIIANNELMSVINSSDDEETLKKIFDSDKKVFIFDLQISSDSLDIVLYLFFKAVYEQKTKRGNNTHLCLILEEAHRYINRDIDENKLGNYYIDKLAREGRKFSIGLIIASQVPSLLAYEIVSQCNSVVMHKITSRKDLEFLRGVLRVSNDTFYLQMSALEKQHAIVCGEAFTNDSIVKIHSASPLPKSTDPIISKLK